MLATLPWKGLRVTPAVWRGNAPKSRAAGVRANMTWVEAHYNNTQVDQRAVRCEVACIAVAHSTAAWVAASTAALAHGLSLGKER